jgi:predicted methyltransferase
VGTPSGATVASAPTDAETRAALAGSARTEAERARDVYRHPLETLKFFGLRDDMNVVELWAPQGYYTAILAPVLRDRGKLAVTLFDPDNPPKLRFGWDAKYVERLGKSPDVYPKVEQIVMKEPGTLSFGADGSADLVPRTHGFRGWSKADG